MKRSRLTIDVSPEMLQLIKIAAIQNDLSISKYVVRILEQAVPDEVRMIQRQREPMTPEKLEHILRAREEIMQHTGGRVFEDSTEIVRQMREERSQELEQL